MFKHHKMSGSKYIDCSGTTAVARKRKKAFTLVEMVIVIAVIGVLATVLISSFATVQNNATKTAALQSMKSSYDALHAEDVLDGDVDYGNGVLLYKSQNSDKLFYVIVTEGELGEVGSVTDTNKNQSTAEDFFALTKDYDDATTDIAISPTNNTADQFDAKVNKVGDERVLTIYLYSDSLNTSGSKDLPLVNSKGSTLDTDGSSGNGYVYADNKGGETSVGDPATMVADRRVDGLYLAYNQAAHIVWGGTTDIDTNGRGGALYDMAHNDSSAVKFISTGAEHVTTLNIGAADAANATISSVKATGPVKIARVEAYDGAVKDPTIVTPEIAGQNKRH